MNTVLVAVYVPQKAPVKLLDKWMHGYKETSDEQVVVLSQVLNAEINIGYEYVTNATVHRFNNVKVRNLAHLARMVEKCEEYVTAPVVRHWLQTG